MKQIYNSRFMLWGLLCLGLFLFSCSDKEDSLIETEALTIKFSAPEYKVKVGEEVTIIPEVNHITDPVYSWKLGEKIISTDTELVFKGTSVDEYFVTLRVDGRYTYGEEQIKISVLEKIMPEIDMPSSLIAYAGIAKQIEAEALYVDEGTTYVWRLNGKVVSKDKIYTYNERTLGAQSLSLKVTNDDGADLKVFTITTLPEPIPELFFDNGHYRVASNIKEMRKMTVPLGKTLVLAPVVCHIENPTTFTWQVDGAVQSSTTEFLKFTPKEKGTYLVTVTEKSTAAFAQVEVTCTEPEGTFFRSVQAGNKATAATAFDYVPAPGQFINYQVGSTKARALQDLQKALDGGNASYIGAYGGYWIVGFDHSVKNVAGKADLYIGGNAFQGWSEPGIVWVMQDENGNGLPDDTWYELGGSETGKEETQQRYAMTYYKPTKSGSDVLWTDNIGRTNSVDYNGYHSQAYYYPMFVEEDYYMVVGTCLASGVFTEGGIVKAKDFPWGYVDNYNTDPTRPSSEFWIEDAIQADGTPAKLTHIDFVRVHTGMAGKGAAVGEISTEPGCPKDLNFNK